MLKSLILLVAIFAPIFGYCQTSNQLDRMIALEIPDLQGAIDDQNWMLNAGQGVQINIESWPLGRALFRSIGHERVVRLESSNDSTLLLIVIPRTSKISKHEILQELGCYRFERTNDPIPLRLIDEAIYRETLFLTKSDWSPIKDDPSTEYARTISLEAIEGVRDILKINLLNGDYGDATLTFTADSVVPKIDRHE